MNHDCQHYVHSSPTGLSMHITLSLQCTAVVNKHTYNPFFILKAFLNIFFFLCAARDGSLHLYTGLKIDVMYVGKDLWVKRHRAYHSLPRIYLDTTCVHCLFSFHCAPLRVWLCLLQNPSLGS